MKNTNSNVKKTKGARRAQKFGFAPYLRPKGGPLGRSAQVGRTLSHEQNRLTLSRLGVPLVRLLSLAIHISHNNGAIDTIQSGKVVASVLAMHCAL